MKHIPSLRIMFTLWAALVLAACANLQQPAQKLLADIDAAVAAAGADAQQYIPDQLADVKQRLGDLKAAFDKQDYKAVMAGAPALLTSAKALAAAAAAKKTEVLEKLNTQWTALATALPQTVAAIDARIATIAKTRKLPAGVTKDGVTAAKSALADAKSAWNDATSTFGAGNVQGALDKANAVKAQLDGIAAKLGIAATSAG